jgi:hypothetical protein
MPSPRTPAQRGRNYTVNIRMSRDEIEAARKLGSGNVSMGFRQAIRYAMDRDMEANQTQQPAAVCRSNGSRH